MMLACTLLGSVYSSLLSTLAFAALFLFSLSLSRAAQAGAQKASWLTHMDQLVLCSVDRAHMLPLQL